MPVFHSPRSCFASSLPRFYGRHKSLGLRNTEVPSMARTNGGSAPFLISGGGIGGGFFPLALPPPSPSPPVFFQCHGHFGTSDGAPTRPQTFSLLSTMLSP